MLLWVWIMGLDLIGGGNGSEEYEGIDYYACSDYLWDDSCQFICEWL